MLTGQNGILTNAQKANYSNVYHGADEQVKLAYMSVKTEIMSQKVADSSYNATTSDSTKKLGEIVEKDLDPNKEKKDWIVDYSVAGVITITYKNPSIGKLYFPIV